MTDEAVGQNGTVQYLKSRPKSVGGLSPPTSNSFQFAHTLKSWRDYLILSDIDAAALRKLLLVGVLSARGCLIRISFRYF